MTGIGRLKKMLTEQPKFVCPVCGWQPVAAGIPIKIECMCGRISVSMPELWECATPESSIAMLRYKYEDATNDVMERCQVCKGRGTMWYNYTNITRVNDKKIKEVRHWTFLPNERTRHNRSEDPFEWMKPCFRCLGNGRVPKIDGLDNKSVYPP